MGMSLSTREIYLATKKEKNTVILASNTVKNHLATDMEFCFMLSRKHGHKQSVMGRIEQTSTVVP